ncbi:MAG: signal peptide peptidase SppA [Verrucomicrobia bacterium]|nr:signal peptide peptidase SppA [Verrucomicrobiota bacterium]MCH8528104.1 signal peptide peptidase SppA [Kiritimatiellia bacterium]
MSDSFNLPPPESQPPPLPRSIEPGDRPRKPGRWRRKLFRGVLGVSLLLNAATCSRMMMRAQLGEEEFPPVSETLAFGSPHAETKVALLRFEGVILRQAQGFWGTLPDPVTALLREIQAATMDPTVRAILLEVNSPGGGVTASDEIYDALMRFRASDPDRVIVGMVQDTAASGAYYFLLAAHEIWAQPTSVVGSVGVMVSTINFHQLAQRLGVEDVTLTSGGNKAMLSPFRPLDTEHVAIFQDVVNDLYARFRDLVVEHRPFDLATASRDGLLDGRIFTARDALRHQLVDGIGYGADVRARVAERLGAEELGFYTFRYSAGFSGLFGARGPSLPAALGLPGDGSARFLYLWQP